MEATQLLARAREALAEAHFASSKAAELAGYRSPAAAEYSARAATLRQQAEALLAIPEVAAVAAEQAAAAAAEQEAYYAGLRQQAEAERAAQAARDEEARALLWAHADTTHYRCAETGQPVRIDETRLVREGWETDRLVLVAVRRDGTRARVIVDLRDPVQAAYYTGGEQLKAAYDAGQIPLVQLESRPAVRPAVYADALAWTRMLEERAAADRSARAALREQAASASQAIHPFAALAALRR